MPFSGRKFTRKTGRLKMCFFVFILTMPEVGSWNGKWTGEGKFYAEIRSEKEPAKTKRLKDIFAQKNFRYDFGDGWVMNIEVKEIYANQLNKIKRETQGFCGYSWAIDSIIKYGKILTKDEAERLYSLKPDESIEML